MATLVVYGNAADGYLAGTHAVYATARTTGGTFVGPVTTSYVVGQSLVGATYSCYESFLSFTHGLSGIYCLSAVLSLCPNTAATYPSTDFTMKVYEKAWTGGGLTTADWLDGSTGGGTVVTSASTAGMEQYRYVDFPAIAVASTTLPSAFLIRSSLHEAGTTPTTETEYVGFYTVGEAGTTRDPKMTYTYYGYTRVGHVALTGALNRATVWPRCLTAAEVTQAFGAGMTIQDRNLAAGTAVLQGTCRNRKGAPVPATHVRAGWWLQHLEAFDGKPIYITGHSVNVAEGKNAVTLGADWMEKEIGVRMADLLAFPATVEQTAAEAAAADPTQPGEGDGVRPPEAHRGTWQGGALPKSPRVTGVDPAAYEEPASDPYIEEEPLP